MDTGTIQHNHSTHKTNRVSLFVLHPDNLTGQSVKNPHWQNFQSTHDRLMTAVVALRCAGYVVLDYKDFSLFVVKA